MPAISASAPGKVILFGEHAVVYGRPAIAVPVTEVRAKAIILAEPLAAPGSVRIEAPDIGLRAEMRNLPPNHPLVRAISLVFTALGVSRSPAFSVRVTSTIPVASGLGSGAAVSAAVIRSVAAFLGKPLPDDQVCALAYEVEKIHHGNPSGIDNTVVAYLRPVYFVRGHSPEPLVVGQPFTLLIGDTGVRSPTAHAVAGVRERWQADPAGYEAIYDRIGEIAEQARRAIEMGQVEQLGPLMDDNQAWLEKIGVSSPALDRLITAARQAGAAGAKLSGAGLGGNMIALAAPEKVPEVARILLATGAVQVIQTEIKPV